MADETASTDRTGTGPGARTLIGLLADTDRRRVLAAIELGSTTLDSVTAATGLSPRRAVKALGRLLDAGVVSATGPGGLSVASDVFTRAARDTRQRVRHEEHAAEPPEIRCVLDAFVREGRIMSMPAGPWKRRVVLDWLAHRFEPGLRYPEAEVNKILDGHAEDPATLRRHLIDASFLARADGVYWRAGGTFDPRPSASIVACGDRLSGRRGDQRRRSTSPHP